MKKIQRSKRKGVSRWFGRKGKTGWGWGRISRKGRCWEKRKRNDGDEVVVFIKERERGKKRERWDDAAFNRTQRGKDGP